MPSFSFLLLFYLAACPSLSSAQDSPPFFFLDLLFSCEEPTELPTPQGDEIGKGRINNSQLLTSAKLPPFTFFLLTSCLVLLHIPDSLTMVSGLIGDKVMGA